MTSDPHKNISKFPILVRPWRIFGAIPQNCWESNPASSWGTKNPPFFCGGKSSTVEDIVDLFRSERFAFSTALDIGTGQGSTAAALAVNFGIVLATERTWGGYWDGSKASKASLPHPSPVHKHPPWLARKWDVSWM